MITVIENITVREVTVVEASEDKQVTYVVQVFEPGVPSEKGKYMIWN